MRTGGRTRRKTMATSQITISQKYSNLSKEDSCFSQYVHDANTSVLYMSKLSCCSSRCSVPLERKLEKC